MFCWLLTIFLLGLAFGLSDGGKLAKLVTFLTADDGLPAAAAVAKATAGGSTACPDGGVDVEPGIRGLPAAPPTPATAATAATEDEAADEAAAAAAAAATLFRLKWTMSSSISVARI